ncbi:TraR/DksA C4-type zinc finger protein [Desulfofalx alkaliphila]|uniref:TraR/DksA C4-type zinc finger protein n=1 Tax=Desulfofalx alkaliphila TaxID=105483 RepID=UPI0006909A45|nr:TraR/DksA C4-type zinc finger protein [Desulfofalx alkaliphila]
MQHRQLQYLKHLMLKEKQQQLERIRSINEGGLGESMDNSFGELSTIDNHPGDVGTEMFERSKDFALKEQASTVIKAIDKAMQAMNEGTYGKCERCGANIPYERLEAMPYTTICKHCKTEDENAATGRYSRPVEEEVLLAPFERSFNDNTEKNFYDGEDTWQEVARHGTSYEIDPEYEVDSIDPEGDQGQVQGAAEEVENIPYELGDDGMFYESFRPMEEFGSEPVEKINVGKQHHKNTESPQDYDMINNEKIK